MEEEKLESGQTQPEQSGSEETPTPGLPPEPASPEVQEDEEPRRSEEDQPTAVPPALPPEGRFRRGFRLVIRWTAGLLLVFALGFLAATLSLFLPKSREVVRVEDQLKQANTSIVALEDALELSKSATRGGRE